MSGALFLPGFPHVYLEVAQGMARYRLRPVSGPVFLIGTGGDNDLVLGDPQFPEVHSYLFVNPEVVSLRHMGEGPEITVNGRPVRTTMLEDGDRLRTGAFEFKMRIEMPVKADDRPGMARPHGHVIRRGRTQRPDQASTVRGLLEDVHSLLDHGAVSPPQRTAG